MLCYRAQVNWLHRPGGIPYDPPAEVPSEGTYPDISLGLLRRSLVKWNT